MRVKDTLKRMGLTPSKRKGQNFLIDETVMDSIVAFGKPQAGERVVEIGPGLGALTQKLNPHNLVGVVEIEESFCDELKRQYPHIVVAKEDARTVEFGQFGPPVVVFGNLPYSFSTEIIFHLIDCSKDISRAVLMLQREFAERMAAGPGGRDYGVLSIGTQLRADIHLGPIVPGNSFHPPTKVDSRLVELKFFHEDRFGIPDVAWFKWVVRASFSQRRKKLRNSLMGSGLDIERVDRGLLEANIDGGLRAEVLAIPDFCRLAKALRKPDSKNEPKAS